MLMKNFLIKTLSIGVYPQLAEHKKLAIQAATFDGMATIITMFFYLIYTFQRGDLLISACFVPGISIMCFGLWLLCKHHYDSARYILHLTALAQIFVTADAAGGKAGYEFYYFTSLIVPFVTFTIEEQKKGLMLTSLSCVVMLIQQLIGTGLIFEPLPVSEMDKFVSLVVVTLFMIAFLMVAKWQINISQKLINQQQGELIHSTNLKALGEMAGGIAHEINNPLQALSLQSKALKSSIAELRDLPPAVSEQLETVDATIYRIAKLIKGLKHLSRDDSNDPAGYFVMKEVIEDVLSVSSERIKNLGIQLKISGDTNLAVNGHIVQVSQVLINLLNNSIDALKEIDEKWITIHLWEKENRVLITVTDSGKGIPNDKAHKLMLPFFTTKEPGQGTGLGLSISKSIVEKSGGNLYLDTRSPNTCFVIELPGLPDSFI